MRTRPFCVPLPQVLGGPCGPRQRGPGGPCAGGGAGHDGAGRQAQGRGPRAGIRVRGGLGGGLVEVGCDGVRIRGGWGGRMAARGVLYLTAYTGYPCASARAAIPRACVRVCGGGVCSGCGAGMGYKEPLTSKQVGKCHSLPPPGRRRLAEAMVLRRRLEAPPGCSRGDGVCVTCLRHACVRA